MNGLVDFSKNAFTSSSKAMIFCAFLDPESIGAVDDGGGIGSDQLIGVFKHLLESCFIAETSSWTLGSKLTEVVMGLPDPDTRHRMTVLLG